MMLKVAELAPGAMLTLAGTVATVLLVVSATIAPLAGAGLVRVTVPTEVEPPTTLDGFSVSDESTAGAAAVTVRVADLLTPA
jgi:Na+-transporting methylmalonyl-CoA/oxaloacetate decarboxylase gamma subunit